MRTNEYDLRDFWLSFYRNKRPTLVSDVVWDYYCGIFEDTLHWNTEWNQFQKLLKDNNLEKIDEVIDFFTYKDTLVKSKIDLSKIEPDYPRYGIPGYSVLPDGYYFSIDLCNAFYTFLYENNATTVKTFGELVECDDENSFLNNKYYRYHILDVINFAKQGHFVNKQSLDDIFNSNHEMIYSLKNVEHNSYYSGDSIIFNIKNENDVEYFNKFLTNKIEIEGHYAHTDISKKTTLTFDRFLSRLHIFDSTMKRKLFFKGETFYDWTMFLPQIQKLYLNQPINDKDLLYGVYDVVKSHKYPLKLI